MRKSILILVLLWILLVVAAASHVYPDGWYWNLPGGHWCGFEVSPTFGPFCDVT